ncbi:MAG: hypothetical protein DRH12_06030 [Deltaproteobacteria bacterium]|nr:MAG: hypothetical protein DRH12_06030 [Deltaproteobacteria bacterium]
MRTLLRALLDYRLCRFLALVWMALIFWLSSLPDIPGPDLFSAQDKLGHFIVFGILGFFISRALGTHGPALGWRGVMIVTLAVAAYGATDELHQMFVPGRNPSILDLLADTLGGFSFAALSYRYLQV